MVGRPESACEAQSSDGRAASGEFPRRGLPRRRIAEGMEGCFEMQMFAEVHARKWHPRTVPGARGGQTRVEEPPSSAISTPL